MAPEAKMLRYKFNKYVEDIYVENSKTDEGNRWKSINGIILCLWTGNTVMRNINERAGTKASIFRSSNQKRTLIWGTGFDDFLTRTTFKN